MKAKHGQHESAIERLRVDLAYWLADAARRETEWKIEAAKRDKNNTCWSIGVFVAYALLLIAVVKLP